jgi:hypothetical protein
MKISTLFIALFFMISTVGFGQTNNEGESNNSFDVAKLITENSVTYGNLTENDLDYFKVQVTQTGVLGIDFNDIPSNIYGVLEFYDASKNVINTYTTDGRGKPIYFDMLVTPGLYYMRLKSYYGTDFSTTLLYKLTLSLDVSDKFEYNNTPATAKLISKDTTLFAKIRGYGVNWTQDIDYYKVNVTQSGVLGINLTDVPSNIYAVMDFLDNNQNVINTYTTDGRGKPIYFDMLVTPATYFIKIRSYYGSDWSADPYKLQLSMDYADKFEYNNTIATAPTVSTDTTLFAKIRGYGTNWAQDIDHYKVNVTRTGVLGINLTDVPSNIYAVMDFLDNNQNVINTYTTDGRGKPIYFDMLVTPATYFIKIRSYYGSDWSVDPYKLVLSMNYSDACEYNNTSATACSLPANTDVKGAIRGYGTNWAADNDFYKFKPTSACTGATVQLTNVPANIYAVMELLDNNLNSVRNVTSGVRGQSISFTQNLNATQYFIKLSSYYTSDWSTDLYTIRLSGCTVSTAIGGNVNEIRFSLSPNPVTDRLSLTYTEGSLKTATITDIAGRTLIQQTVNDKQAEINVQSLPKGLYLLTVQTTDGKRGVQKFIKN